MLYSQKKEKIEELKTYALCACVNNNYSVIDSTFRSSDVTNSYIVQATPLGFTQLMDFDNFIREQTKDFYKILPYGSYDVPKANMIFFFCTEFYKSERLDKYIKKELKRKINDDPAQ